MTAERRPQPLERRTGRPATCSRCGSFDVADFPVPTGREEEWRFTPLKRLRGLHDGRRPLPAARVTRRGRRCPTGVTVETVERATTPRLGSALRPGRPGQRAGVSAPPSRRCWSTVAAGGRARPSRSVIGCVGDGADRRRPTATRVVEVGRVRRGDRRARPHRLGDAGRQRRGRGRRRRAADRRHRRRTGPTTPCTAQHLTRPARPRRHGHARRRSPSAATWCGSTPRVDYAGRGGEAELLGLYFADAGQHLEHRLLVDHNAPDCRSNVAYKGALQGEDAHTVWIGDVLIRPGGRGTDTYEINRNLVLTDGARADSVPNLEIETGEIVGAGHASADRPLRRRAAVLPDVARHPRGRGAPAGRARLLRRAAPQDRRAGAARSGCCATIEAELAKDGALSVTDDLRPRLRVDDVADGTAARASTSTARRSPSCTRRTTSSTPIARRVLARRRSRCPRARSTAARSSAGCTARASTCAPASRPACRPPSRPRLPRRDPRRRRLRRASTPEQWSDRPMSTLEIRDLHVVGQAARGRARSRSCTAST